jgi:hypothetical protein
MDEDESTRCPRCGGPLSPGPGGEAVCPACLLSGAAGPDTENAGSRGRFRPPDPEELAPLLPALEIVRLIGQGGMGAVYEARQLSLDRRVALKVLPPEVAAEPAFAERFERESRTLARLDHPGIVTVHDSGRAGEFYYFVMEFVDGTHLRDLVAARRLSPREALGIVPQICDALQYAHDHGVVHRDIKPENILVDRRGQLKITDFGLAKLLAPTPRDLSLTATRLAVGTPAYMAPEQLEHPDQVDHRADIYSLGVVFYELLTGELPLGRFDAPSQRVQVDVRLDDIVLRTLEKEPTRRYQTASEVGTDVRHVSDGDDPPVRKTVPRAAADGSGLSGWLFLGAAAAYAALGLALGLLWNLGPAGLSVGALLAGALTLWIGSRVRRGVPSLREAWERSSWLRRAVCGAAVTILMGAAVAIGASVAVSKLDESRFMTLGLNAEAAARDPQHWAVMARESGLDARSAAGVPVLSSVQYPAEHVGDLDWIWVVAIALLFVAGLLALETGDLRGTWRWSVPLAALLVLCQLCAPIALAVVANPPVGQTAYDRSVDESFSSTTEYERLSEWLDAWLTGNPYDLYLSLGGDVIREDTGEKLGSFRHVVIHPVPVWSRWRWRWGKPALDRPIFSVEFYGPAGGSETAVRIRSTMVRRGVEDSHRWGHLLDHVRAVLE